MRKFDTVTVDKEKFIAVLEKKGETLLSAGNKIGRAQGYFSKRLSRYNAINTTDAIALEAVLGIKRKDYEQVEKEEPKPVTTQSTEVKVEIDYDKLQKTIYEAVYGAMINADNAIRESR